MEERLGKLSLGEDRPPPPAQTQSKPKLKTGKNETAVAGPSKDPPSRNTRTFYRTKINPKFVHNSNTKPSISQQKRDNSSPKIRILQRPVTNGDKPKSSPVKMNSKQHQQQPAKNGHVKQDQAALPQTPKAGPSNKTDIEKAQQQKALKEQRLRDKIARRRAEADLRLYFENTHMSAEALVSKQHNERFLADEICSFMNHLQKRLSDPDCTYTDLADKRQEDYAFYGDRLLNVISKLNLSKKVKENYERVLEHYQNLHPPSIWRFRRKLLCIKDEVLANRNQPRQAQTASLEDLDFRMVTYKQINPMDLHRHVCQLPDSETLKYFIQEISLSDEGFQNLNRFVDALRIALEDSPIAAFNVKVHPFGSLSNGLATFDSDLDIVLQFNKVLNQEDRLDFETSLLILNIVKTILTMKLDVCRGMPRNVIVPSKRCPIIKIDFKQCFQKDVKKWLMKNDNFNTDGPLAFNKCDISVTSTYGIHNSRLLKFLTLYDRRFYEMALLLKYWAKKNVLICTEGFSSYAFMLLIIFFLQTREPMILPPISLLQKLAIDHPKKFKQTTVHGWKFGFADDIALVRKTVGCQENTQKTEQLIPEFFHFYHEFDYSKMAISTRLGILITKEELFAEKKTKGLEMAFKESIVVIEDPFVLEHNPGSIFHGHYMPKWLGTLSKLTNNWNVDEKNVVPLLTDPNCWDPTPPPKSEANKERKAVLAALRKERKEKKKILSEQNAKKPSESDKNETGDL